MTPARKDKVSKPSEGRYFAYGYHEFASRVEELAFAVHYHDERLPVFLENCEVECPLGIQLCSLLRRSYIAQFCVPQSVPSGTARKAVEATLGRLRKIDAGPELAVRDQQFVVYRAYLRPVGVLSVTQHVVNGRDHSYLRFRALSRLSRAQSDPDNQRILLEMQVG
jgi:hypothetical protein